MNRRAASSGHREVRTLIVESISRRVAQEPVKMTILSAAMQRLGSIPLDKLSINMIAQASQFSRPTIYSYFKNKGEIVAAVNNLRAELVNEFIELKISGVVGALNKLEEAVIAAVQFGIEDKQSRQIEELSAPNQMLLFGAEDRLPQPASVRWHHLLQEAVRVGEIRADLNLDLAVNWVVSAHIILVSRVLGLGESLDDVRQYVRLFLIEGLRARP